MDLALQEMKSFLRKLECKQAHIELDHWKIQKQISTLRQSLEGAKEINDKIEQMTKNSLEQEKQINDLKVQISKLKKREKHEMPKSDSFGKTLKKAVKLTVGPHKTHDDKQSALMYASNEIFRDTDSEFEETCKESKDADAMRNTKRKSLSANKSAHSDYSYVLRTVDNEILDRYLKDAANYHVEEMSDEETINRTEKSKEVLSKNEDENRSDSVGETVTQDKSTSHLRTSGEFRCMVASAASITSKLLGNRRQLKKANCKKIRRKILRDSYLGLGNVNENGKCKLYNCKHCLNDDIREVFRSRRKR